MNKIRNVSLFFKIIFQLVLLALPALLILSWIAAPNELVLLGGIIKLNAIPANYAGMHAYSVSGIHFLPPASGEIDKAILHTLTTGEKISGCLISFIPTLINMFIVYSLIKLFNLYAKK